MTDSDRKAANTRCTRASKSLDAMRATIARADAARSDAAHQARAAHVVDAARRAVTDNRAAVEAWDALATHAATQASDCRRGAVLADRTRHRWARYAAAAGAVAQLRVRGRDRCVRRRVNAQRRRCRRRVPNDNTIWGSAPYRFRYSSPMPLDRATAWNPPVVQAEARVRMPVTKSPRPRGRPPERARRAPAPSHTARRRWLSERRP